MAKSRTRKKPINHSNKKQMSKKEEKPVKQGLIPKPEWQSTEELVLRGDLLEGIDRQLALTHQNIQGTINEFNKLIQLIQMVMGHNIKLGKVKLTYVWNTGEPATAEEVKEFESQVEELQRLREQQLKDEKAQENAAKTGLVGPNGQPVGTTQDLSESDESTAAQIEFERANLEKAENQANDEEVIESLEE